MISNKLLMSLFPSLRLVWNRTRHVSLLNLFCFSGSHEVAEDLDEVTFRDCKERLRPVKKALKQLDRPPAAPSGNQEQVKTDHIRRCLLQIGDRVIECLREIQDMDKMKKLRRNLWIFVSKFTEFNAEKLQKLYKISMKRREFERKSKVKVGQCLIGSW